MGFKVQYRNDVVFMSQLAYVYNSIDTANIWNEQYTTYALPFLHPFYEAVTDLAPFKAAETGYVPFLKFVAALLFRWTQTMPDISTAVSMVAKFQSNTKPIHCKMLKNFVRYLIGTK